MALHPSLWIMKFCDWSTLWYSSMIWILEDLKKRLLFIKSWIASWCVGLYTNFDFPWAPDRIFLIQYLWKNMCSEKLYIIRSYFPSKLNFSGLLGIELATEKSCLAKLVSGPVKKIQTTFKHFFVYITETETGWNRQIETDR